MAYFVKFLEDRAPKRCDIGTLPSNRSRQVSGDVTTMTSLNQPETSIQQFYKGATVFVTGGTGFVGQLIIEKLLRCCPGLRKIYVLVRPKKNKNGETRLREQFKDVLYDKLREVNPNFESQVEAISGDCGELGLGISNDERTTLISEVSVIFHSAATVRFDESLKLAVEINTRGTREVLQLAKACVNLEALVHVSTAYSNCYESDIEERFYSVEVGGDDLIAMAENMSEDVLNRIAPGLLQGHPNTYTYTKKAAEDLVRQHGRDIPCAVVRPSIIVGTAEEPLEGWSGNLYGPGSAFLGIGIGLIHTMLLNVDNVIDAVPADYVSNTCLAVAWDIARTQRDDVEREPPVYMCGTSPQTPITWKEFNEKAEKVYYDIPTPKAFYKFFYILTTKMWLYKIIAFIFHWIPAYIFDAVLQLLGKKPQFKKIYTKVDQLVTVQEYFALRSWMFHNDNTVKVYREMSQADKKIFKFDFKNMDWDAYIKSYITGTRLYVLKDPIDTIPEGKTRRTQLDVLNYFVCSLLVLFAYGVFKFFALLF